MKSKKEWYEENKQVLREQESKRNFKDYRNARVKLRKKIIKFSKEVLKSPKLNKNHFILLDKIIFQRKLVDSLKICKFK